MLNTKILRFFLDHPHKQFSQKDICQALDISRNGSFWAMVDLLFQKMIVEEKGRPNMYRLNKDLVK